MRPLTLALLLALATLAVPAPAAAHEFWFAPSRYRAAAGDTVTLRAHVGDGFAGPRVAYARRRVVRFERHADAAADLAPVARDGERAFGRFVATDEGGALIGYESGFSLHRMSAEAFDRYLAEEGLDGPLAARRRLGPAAGPGRERYARCAKAWIAGTAPARALAPLGLTLELVPLADPAGPGPLELRVEHRGEPLAGALVRAWNQPPGPGVQAGEAASRESVEPSAEARTDRGGVVRLAVDRPGEWLVGVVHMVPSTVRTETDWESYWATFTFSRGAPPR